MVADPEPDAKSCAVDRRASKAPSTPERRDLEQTNQSSLALSEPRLEGAKENVMGEVKYDRSHPAGATPEARIANRLRNSGEGLNADVTTKQGEGPQRVFHNVMVNSGNKPRGGSGEKR
jgi:hypothetical protein